MATSLFIPKLPFLSPNPNAKPNSRFQSKKPLHLLPPINASSPSPFRNGTPPETDCPVPHEQRPVNEYQSLASSLPFCWATKDLNLYISRLAATGASFGLLVGLPVAAFRNGSVADPWADVIHIGLGATSAGLLAVTLAVLRIYLGWAYVGNRLLSATVEYEETGWYDGQIWVKTPEVLARDRLLGSFTVKPILNRVKYTLIGLAVSLVVCALLFVNTGTSKDLSDNAERRVVPGKYSDEAARFFEPEAFCGEPDLS
ncbi:hypothetical protein LUZ62_064749 [Rhynchospora pubera]|uniref:Uncharacterized protein n=1 Tax=Rhynchospora pubera TaxID=906938 RepID=A0AAV8DQT4_9POAL|nr:hypothetical protein LUZ62_055832 [Rhynchospora pubera]KAJ4780492.1 hypothetical protein LUZ62_064749 [Rhynchospora pubera]